MGKWVNIRVWPFMTIVYVTIVLSELISVVATAVVKSNKKSPSKHFKAHLLESKICVG